MALEAVVFPHYLVSSGSWPWGWSVAAEDKGECFDGNRGATCSSNSKLTMAIEGNDAVACAGGGRKKRRRSKISLKNKEASEQQRMAHIAVERNRRKQMNDYLAVLRSLMPPSYINRVSLSPSHDLFLDFFGGARPLPRLNTYILRMSQGDQASTVGSAINFIKELEHLLLSVEIQSQLKQPPDPTNPPANLFTFSGSSSNSNSAFAGIQVAVVEVHASLKVVSRRRPKQLLHLVTGLQNLRLSTLHLNVTAAADPMILYSLSLKGSYKAPVTILCGRSSTDLLG
ncbi:Transcription factor bHLH94 [Platanthera guangdongensis]|uniref:Transcription factor bHLH94 n=1 Tax=Platanthera guangdongensis TaxID=2320717 RepID=A0ABR2N3M4_9ASPA